MMTVSSERLSGYAYAFEVFTPLPYSMPSYPGEKVFVHSSLAQAGQKLGFHGPALVTWLSTPIQSPSCFT